MKKHHRHENDCLNCGAELQGKYCHECGQENLHLKESFGHMMVHAIGDYFHFDEKFFHTLKPLFFKPGKLTIDYNAGKRTQYLHPVRMYIFISVVYFLLVFSHQNEEKKALKKRQTKEHTIDSIKQAFNNDPDMPAIGKALTNKSLDKVKAATNEDSDSDENITPLVKIHTDHKNDRDTTYAQYLQSQQKLAPDERDGFVNRYFTGKAYEWKKKGMTPKQALEENFVHNFPKMMFLMLPVFALLLKLTFWKNRKYYIEHLIYAFHLFCFIFLFLTIEILIKMILPHNWHAAWGWLDFFSAIAVFWYVYRSLKVVYQRSRFRTLTKMFGITFVYTVLFSIGLLIYLVITAALT